MHTNYGYFNEKFLPEWTQQVEAIKAKFGEGIFETILPAGMGVSASERWGITDLPVIMVKKDSLIALLEYLKSELDYDFLTDYTATDENEEPVHGCRFVVVAHLFSTAKKIRIRVKSPVAESESVPTLIGLWPGANWAEREIFDMFGIKFEDHPELRRILMDSRFEGHPLRKDYPIRGYQVFLTPEPLDPELLK